MDFGTETEKLVGCMYGAVAFQMRVRDIQYPYPCARAKLYNRIF